MLCKLFEKHKWTTVAIDTSHGWIRYKTNDKNDVLYEKQHIIKFIKCSRCGKRTITADDPDEFGRTYALEKHTHVALARAIWEDAGKITDYRPDSIVWVDPDYAPLSSVTEVLKTLRADPKFADLLKEQLVEDALGQLEVVVKLFHNNESD